MPLLLGQLVYTSFPTVGFKALASAQVPLEIQQAFVQQVVYQHWDSYNPPEPEYRAVYLHQITPEHTLFGWLYNDGLDDLGRRHVPYFICYYLAERLHTVQLENIFTCLHRGPVALIDRQSLPATLETVAAPDLWSYQPARMGVAIPTDVRERSHTALKQRRLLNLLAPAEREMLALNGQTHEQQRVALPYTDHLVVEGIETGIADINESAATSDQATKSYQEYQQGLQLYEQVLVDAVEYEYPLSDRTRLRLELLQQVSGLKHEDIAFIEKRIAQQKAVQSPVAGSMEAQLTRNKAAAPVQLLNKVIAASKANVPTKLELPVISSSRGLAWGLIGIVTMIAVALSFVLLRSRLTSLPNSRSSPSVVPTPLAVTPTVDQPRQPGEKQEDKQHSASVLSESIPGFPTGTSESAVAAALGQPTQTSTGYWPNTRTALYELVPNQITIAYLFDHDSGRVRQTEASFAQSADPQVMQATLQGMLDGEVTQEIQQGLQRVQQRQSNQYSFTTGRLKGTIERIQGDRIYIGIWDADLH